MKTAAVKLFSQILSVFLWNFCAAVEGHVLSPSQLTRAIMQQSLEIPAAIQVISSQHDSNCIVKSLERGFAGLGFRRRGCGGCVNCSGPETVHQATTARCLGLLSNADGWPGSCETPTEYFEMRARKLNYQQRKARGQQVWRREAGVATKHQAELLQKRCRPALSVLLPNSYSGLKP